MMNDKLDFLDELRKRKKEEIIQAGIEKRIEESKDYRENYSKDLNKTEEIFKKRAKELVDNSKKWVYNIILKLNNKGN